MLLLIGGSFALVEIAAVALVVGLLGILGIVHAPKIATLVGVMMILFSRTLERLASMEMLSFTDELVVVVFLIALVGRRLLLRKSVRLLPGLRWFLVYAASGFVSSTINGVSFWVSVQDAFLFTKGILFAFSVAQVDWTSEDVPKLVRCGTAIAVLVTLATFANLAAPTWWFAHVSVTGAADTRGFFPSLIGPFVHPGVYGQIAALLVAAVAAYRMTIGRSRQTVVLLISSVLFVVLSFRRKAIVGMLAALGSLGRRPSRSFVPTLFLVVVFAAPLLWIVMGGPIKEVVNRTTAEYVRDSDRAARTVLYRDSYKLATKEMPFGVGLGRFGGEVARRTYSPVYDKLGYNRIYGLARRDGQFGADTFWPAVLGETGWLGMVGYAAGLGCMLRLAFRCSRASVPNIRFVGLVGVAWWVEYLVESIAAPVYSSPPSFGLLFGLMGILTVLGTSEYRKDRKSLIRHHSHLGFSSHLNNPRAQ